LQSFRIELFEISECGIVEYKKRKN